MKRVAIDIQTTFAEKTGFGFYVSNLARELPNVEPAFSYTLIAPDDPDHDLTVPRRFLWDQIQFPRRAAHTHADLVHQPGFSVPIVTRSKTVVTVHDLIPRLFGEDIPFWSRQYFGRWMPYTYHRADHIIADSENTKQDILRELSISADKISVVYLAADAMYQPVQDKVELARVQKKYEIPGPYFVHVGTLNPRKNLEFLVKSFAPVAQKHATISLVISGKKGWLYEGLFALVKKLGLTERVIFTGYLDEADKPALLSGATALVFPSLYEGFGLPPLEAMACGTPVLASNSSSIPEVVGDAGLLADPKDKAAWTRMLNQILEQPKLAEQLREKGFVQAKQFSWRKAAAETAAIYQRVLEEK